MIGDLWHLAFNYMLMADKRPADTQDARDWNRDKEIVIKAGIARVTCQR